MISQEGMPRGYVLHYDWQIGYWWTRSVAPVAKGSRSESRLLVVTRACIHAKNRTPRMRWIADAQLWVCWGCGHSHSGRSAEQAYYSWMANN